MKTGILPVVSIHDLPSESDFTNGGISNDNEFPDVLKLRSGLKEDIFSNLGGLENNAFIDSDELDCENPGFFETAGFLLEFTFSSNKNN